MNTLQEKQPEEEQEGEPSKDQDFFSIPPRSSVILGLSGGVDSAAAASLLKSQNIEVHGVFLELFTSDVVQKSRQDALQSAQRLGIPCTIIQAKELFEKKVVTPFVQEYCQGQTPLPCVWCNPFIKFSCLLQVAQKLNIPFVATGHYAQKKIVHGKPVLVQAKTLKQDQSFFLYRLTNEQLNHVVFPLGSLTKQEIRDYAQQIGLPVAQKKSSLDVCFLADHQGDHAAFIQERISESCPSSCPSSLETAGDILDLNSQVLGRHKGSFRYTIGQRKGLGVSAPHPLYVIKIQDKQVFVGSKEDLTVQKLILRDLVLHPIASMLLASHSPQPVRVKFRSTTPPVQAVWDPGNQEVTFEEKQYGVASGQSAVFYSEDGWVLGGGIIQKTLS